MYTRAQCYLVHSSVTHQPTKYTHGGTRECNTQITLNKETGQALAFTTCPVPTQLSDLD